ncbi:MAG: hypothetical protein IPL08_19835 [Saprospiraceae bacterium]|nr:hypothetical protein [Saprospiraceae bacterium]
MGSDTPTVIWSCQKQNRQVKISGGSSGGAAVSVQADTCLVALGTDTGGGSDNRQPMWE